MTASVFLSAFIGCLFALAFVAIGMWQLGGFLIRRWLHNNAEEFFGDLAKRVGINFEAIKAEMNGVHAEPPTQIGGPPAGPFAFALTCSSCGSTTLTSCDPESLGWKRGATGWVCPACSRKEPTA